MTAGHLLLAGGLSIYMLIAIRYEERDLTDLFGDDYRRLPRRASACSMPRFRRRSAEPPDPQKPRLKRTAAPMSSGELAIWPGWRR